MDYKEVYSFIENNGGTTMLKFIAKNQDSEAINYIINETNCTEDIAKLVWVDLKIKYGTNEMNPYIEYEKFSQSRQQSSPDPRVPHCPYCGSTSIQAVRRNWSFMRGFATNKIDRVCLNCGKKL